jgi:Flp pilus assembly protein TadG
MLRLRSHRKPSRGQALVEFALIIPLFVLLLFGIVDFGRAVLASNSIANAAREGARTAIVNQRVSDIRDRVIDQATGVALANSDVRIAYRDSSNPNNVTNLCRNSSGAAAPRVGCVAVVTVRTVYQAATPVIGGIVGTICMHSTTMMPIEAVPTPLPPPPPAWTAPCP